MSNQRYPQNLAISAQDFAESGWEEALSQASGEEYPDIWKAFLAAARRKIEQGHEKHGKVLSLLADACSMSLSPSSQNEPYKPFIIYSDQRSSAPDDFSDSDITFFSQIVGTVENGRLKARLADLVWLKGKPRHNSYALMAIDAYQSIPLNADTWFHSAWDCWQRAISLARLLKKNAASQMQQMETSVISTLTTVTVQDEFFGLQLAELLKSCALEEAQEASVASKLATLARDFSNKGNLHATREYSRGAADWYRSVSDQSKETEMRMLVAESWVKEAEVSISPGGSGHMLATHLYEKAIQAYRMIPGSERASHQINERIDELRTKLSESSFQMLGEMNTVRTPGVDISQLIENARRSVTNKSAKEALLAFVNLFQFENLESLRENALKRMRQSPLQALSSVTMMSRDGRAIAKHPGISLSAGPMNDEEASIRAETIRDYRMLISIEAQGKILPALEVLLLEHRLRAIDFVALASESPIVPEGRADLFGKALFMGYDRDFVSALHLLAPQIEHMVRTHLKQAGAHTTNLDSSGIENENSLSTLIDLPETEQIYGKELTFELKSLFCDPFGPNFRNKLAHGLLSAGDCYSVFAIYAWWLGLRIVFKTWWNAKHQEKQDASDANEASQET